MFKIDKYPLGIALGALAPVLGLSIYYLLKFDPSITPPGRFLKFFFATKAMLTAAGTLSLLVNIILFTIFINGRRDKTAIGIFAMTVMYGLIILYAKFFLQEAETIMP